ncbi:glycine-rich domain-containing protein [Pseudomonas sp. zfem002]|uniref:glycine-rich domain-containing protein n=1 Tax=Pseudomonas sp. zfem002 TaxID=3078197 RepID=UPI002928CE33|nr:hypothetical protein [Pseudomonas sp. zfem002]MDU9394083.1 hypothetical protein [Pseudomonas sp. zfem002]
MTRALMLSAGNIAVALLAALAPAAHGANQTYTDPAATQLLELPSDVARVTVTLIGGGGGGGVAGVAAAFPILARPAAGGGGGGGGATLICTLGVLPGSALQVTVGAGGAAGTAQDGDGHPGGASRIRIREPGGGLSAFSFSAAGGEGGGAGSGTLFSRLPGRGGSGGKGSTTPDCVLAEGFAGGNGGSGATADTPGKGAAASAAEAARMLGLLREFKAQREDLASAAAADAARHALCQGAGLGGDGGTHTRFASGPGRAGCVSIDY